MKTKLLEVLREPGTGAHLSLEVGQAQNEEVHTGWLRSAVSGKAYPIRAGIPRFVPDESYVSSFGLQWNRFSQVQLDSVTEMSWSRERYQDEVGWSRDRVRGQWLLDAGCGCGRFAEIAAGLGAEVVCLDYSSAVEAAERNLRALPNAHFVQADLLSPPFATASFAFVYSLGVLQHTPDPQASARSLLSLLSPEGSFAFTIYARRWYTRFNSKYLVRPITRLLPPGLLLRAIELIMPVAFPLTNLLYRIPILGHVAQFAIPLANYVHRAYPSRELQYQEAVLDSFDMLSPAFDLPVTANELERTLTALGVRDLLFRSRVPVNVTGRVPSQVEARHS